MILHEVRETVFRNQRFRKKTYIDMSEPTRIPFEEVYFLRATEFFIYSPLSVVTGNL
jgi:hypothetical protein